MEEFLLGEDKLKQSTDTNGKTVGKKAAAKPQGFFPLLSCQVVKHCLSWLQETTKDLYMTTWRERINFYIVCLNSHVKFYSLKLK